MIIFQLMERIKSITGFDAEDEDERPVSYERPCIYYKFLSAKLGAYELPKVCKECPSPLRSKVLIRKVINAHRSKRCSIVIGCSLLPLAAHIYAPGI